MTLSTDSPARKPKVSVLMITYNHEKYIEQAVRSVMMQETDFDYELIIGEDCSTDGTREIVLLLKDEFPDKIRLLLQPQNMGMIPNFIATYKECTGEYVAICEGDDYWIDDHKLARQAAFLDTSPRYILTGTNAVVLIQETGQLSGVAQPCAVPFDFDAHYLMVRNPLPTLTVMFRNRVVEEFPPIFWSGSGGDRRLYLLMSQYGKCRFEPVITGTYRVHAASATSRQTRSYETRRAALMEKIELAEKWNAHFHNQYYLELPEIRREISHKLVARAIQHLDLRTAVVYSRYISPADFQSIPARLAVWFLRACAHFTVQSDAITDPHV